MKAKFGSGAKWEEVGNHIEIVGEDDKGTVMIMLDDIGRRTVWITGQTDKGDITVLTHPDGKLQSIRVSGDKDISYETEYRHQPNGYLSAPKIINEPKTQRNSPNNPRAR